MAFFEDVEGSAQLRGVGGLSPLPETNMEGVFRTCDGKRHLGQALMTCKELVGILFSCTGK